MRPTLIAARKDRQAAPLRPSQPALLAALIGLAIGAAVIALQGGIGREATAPVTTTHDQQHAAPVAMDGDTLRIVVPAGAAEQFGELGHDLTLPPTIRMRVGQAIEIRNDDRLTHVILGEAVRAGTTYRRVLDTPGLEVYAAGCAVHSVGTGMTTLIISGPAGTGTSS